MKAVARRLLALENSSGQVASVVEAEADRDRALRMMTEAERALAQVALAIVIGEKSWDDHDQATWGWSAPVMTARREIEAADKETARFLASALMTRGRWRWLGRLHDVRLGPFRPWEERFAFPAFDDNSWAQIKHLSADLRRGVAGEEAIVVRP